MAGPIPHLPPKPPDPSRASFLEVMRKCHTPTPDPIPIEPKITYQKEDSVGIFFSKEEYERSLAHMEFALIAKFNQKRVRIEEFDAYIRQMWGLTERFSVGIIDHRHYLVQFSNELDFINTWSRESLVVKGMRFKLMRWSPEFDPTKESTMASIWISLPGLPLNFFHKDYLSTIGGMFGKFLKTDEPSIKKTRPSVARVCVEMNITGNCYERVWIGCGDVGFWQTVIYENIPRYCSTCSMQGHSDESCGIRNKSQLVGKGNTNQIPKVWKEIGRKGEEQQNDQLNKVISAPLMEKEKETADSTTHILMEKGSSSKGTQDNKMEKGGAKENSVRSNMAGANEEGEGEQTISTLNRFGVLEGNVESDGEVQFNNTDKASVSEDEIQAAEAEDSDGEASRDKVHNKENTMDTERESEAQGSDLAVQGKQGTLKHSAGDMRRGRSNSCGIINDNAETEEVFQVLDTAVAEGDTTSGAEQIRKINQEKDSETDNIQVEQRLDKGAVTEQEKEYTDGVGQQEIRRQEEEMETDVWNALCETECRLTGIMQNSAFFNPFPEHPNEELTETDKEETEDPKEKRRGGKKGKKIDYRETIIQSSRSLRRNKREEGRSRSNEEQLRLED